MKTILLVEDNPDDVRLTRRALSQNNITNELAVVSDGVEAVNYLNRAATAATTGGPEVLPTVILLDLKLPRMDGFEVLRRIRADKRLRRLPVVVMTTSKEDIDVLRSYDLGANSFIRKPVDFEEFIEAVRQLVFYWLLLNETAPSTGGSL